ncbi:MAG: PKD-like domain-containing protein [Rikenellaceae bacterium]
MKRYITLIILTLAFISCATDPTQTPQPAPTIELDSESDNYATKVDVELTITPTYENVEGATYLWSLDGVEICSAAQLSYSWSERGDYYILLTVSTDGGTAYREIKVEVSDVAAPVVSLVESLETLYVAKGVEFTLVPSVTSADATSYCWRLDGAQIASTQQLSYTLDEIGEYELTFTATNGDGDGSVEVDLRVVEEADVPFSWSFESVSYNISSGRKIRLKCWSVKGDCGGDYSWSIDGVEVQRGSSTELIFDKTEVAEYRVNLTKYNSVGATAATQDIAVYVCGAEGTHKRTTSGEASFNVIYEFLPAPGQYVNNGYSCATMEEAVAYAQGRLSSGAYLSLGAWGGYVVVGFDHSVECSGGYDLQIRGNYSSTSNEPGIVMVMQDENGDGLPNDTWYELAGSETESGQQIDDYAITYYRPTTSGADVRWVDNLGASGTIDYNTTHAQESYFPQWAEGDFITLYGTALRSKSYSISSTSYVNPPFEWGYADNQSEINSLPNGDTSASQSCNYFKITNAIDYSGEAIALDYIDFVKIYTAVNDKAGWLGEISTEVCGVADYNMLSNVVKNSWFSQ